MVWEWDYYLYTHTHTKSCTHSCVKAWSGMLTCLGFVFNLPCLVSCPGGGGSEHKTTWHLADSEDCKLSLLPSLKPTHIHKCPDWNGVGRLHWTQSGLGLGLGLGVGRSTVFSTVRHCACFFPFLVQRTSQLWTSLRMSSSQSSYPLMEHIYCWSSRMLQL